MGFDIVSGWSGIGATFIVVCALGILIPTIIWFVALTKQAHDDVVEDSHHDIEA